MSTFPPRIIWVPVLASLLLVPASVTVCPVSAAEPTPEKQARRDRPGDPLPEGAIYRVGPSRFRAGWFVYFLAFSKDGKTLLSINRTSSATPDVVRRWDAASGKQLQQFSLPPTMISGSVHSTALSPDGTLLAVRPNAGADAISLVDTATGRVVRNFHEQQHGGGIAFSPDGQSLAMTDSKGTILLWDTASGKALGKLEGGPPKCQSLAFSPDDKLLGSVHDDHTIRLWDRTTRREIRRLRPSRDNALIGAVAFSPDGKLVAAHCTWTIELWSTATGKRVRTLPLKGGSPSSALAFSPDGKLLAARDFYDLRFWEAASGEEIRRLDRFWNLTCLAFSPDGKVLATGDENIHLWQVATGKEIRPGGDEASEITSAAFSPDGQLLATGGPDEFIRLWDADTGASVRRFRGCEEGNLSVNFSPDGKSLFSRHGNQLFSRSKEFFRWDAATGKELRGFEVQPAFEITLSPSGRHLAWFGTDVAIHVRDNASGKESRPWSRDGQRTQRLQFSPREDLLAVNGLSGIRSEILDLATRKIYPTFEEEWDFAGFSPDGHIVARTDKEGRIHFQETATARDLACTRLADVLPFRGGGPRHLYASAFSPDGKTLATAMASEPIRLWETASGKERQRLPGHIGFLKQLAFSPDGSKLVSVSSEKSALVWQMFGLPPGQRPVELSAEQLRKLWADLASDDGGTAFQALRALTAAAPASVVDLLRREMLAMPRLDPRQIARWITELDADDFASRQRATTELEKLGSLADKPLRETLQNRPSVEVRRRIEGLLEKRKDQPIAPVVLRAWRAIEVLEHLATPEARQLLEELSKGEPDARWTREAKASLARLNRHHPPKP